MTAATNRRNRRAQARTRRRAGASWTPLAARQRRADTTTFTYSDPMFLTAVDGPSGRLATYVYDSDSKRRRVYEAAFTTIVWDGWDYLQWRRPSVTHVFHTMNGEIVGESVGGTVRDYLLDPLGSVVATLDGDGVVDQFDYWPYGELVDDLPEGAPVFLWVGGLGYWFDTDERRYVRHRMLRTDLGSWMQLDPLWPRESSYSCADRSPALFVDPTGLGRIFTVLQTYGVKDNPDSGGRRVIPRRGTVDEGIVGLDAGVCVARCHLPDPPGLKWCINKGKKEFEKWVEREWLGAVGKRHGADVASDLKEGIRKFKNARGVGKSWACVLSCFAYAYGDFQDRKETVYPWQTCGLMEEGDCLVCCGERAGASLGYCVSNCGTIW